MQNRIGTHPNHTQMVEGPGCTRNGTKAQALVGSSVIGVAGQPAVRLPVANEIRGSALVDTITLGKQLWLIFRTQQGSERAVRCHFGMAGSLQCVKRVEKVALHQIERSRQAKTLMLMIRFQGDSDISIYDASVSLGDAAPARKLVSEQQHLDVSSSTFDHMAAVATLLAVPPTTMISDALLDQRVLPGVGNIIKNEGHAADTNSL